MIYHAGITLNEDQPALDVTLNHDKNLMLRVGRDAASLTLEQLHTFILSLQAAEVRMRSWNPGSPRWP